MFERFTDCARNLMGRANREAQKLHHDYVGTEHILLALVKENESVGAHVLKNLDVDFKRLKLEVEKLSPPGPEDADPEKLPPDDREKRVIQYAVEEARSLKHSYIGSEHILLGLIKETNGVAAKVFDIMGIHYKDLKTETLNILANVHQH